ncbi:MAG: stage II sporulation E family protein [Planctomycetota bacterium]|nr:MAG: stage II sporulation E family protein [Planctomycetota bacterium]
MLGLVVLAPPALGTRFVLSQQHDAVIGREGFCDLVLMKRTVSRKHARVFFDGKRYQLEDMGSAHGTFLNGSRVTRAVPLKDGDRINVVDVPIMFRELDEAVGPDTSQSHLGLTQRLRDLTPLPGTSVPMAYSGRLRNLLEITRRLGSGLVVDDIFPRVLDLLVDMFPQAVVGEILLADAQEQLNPVAIKHGRDDDSSIITRVLVGDSLARQVFQSGQPQLKSVEGGSNESVLDVSGSNSICVPILGPSHDRLGTILLETDDDHRVFTNDDVELIASIGIVTGQAVEYARAHEAKLRMDQTQRQLDTARQIQMRMLPRKKPKVPGYVFESHYAPADSVGGDFYFWDSMPDGRVAMGIADACGKSLPAALLMAQFAVEVRHCLATAETLKLAMASLNQFVCSVEEGFITFLLCLLDVKTNLLTVVNAGHPPALCRWHDSGNVEPLSADKASLPLGVRPQEIFHPFHALMRPGDEVFLLTDGVTEAMAPNSSLYGPERLNAQIAASQPNLSARVQAIVEDLARFRGNRRPSDDCCLLGVAREVA